jgi:hypothetical protein
MVVIGRLSAALSKDGQTGRIDVFLLVMACSRFAIVHPARLRLEF